MNMRRYLFALVVLLVGIIGCGGGGEGTSAKIGGSGGGTGGLMSDAQRTPIIAAAQTAMQSLPQTNGLIDPNTLLAALQKVSGLNKLVATPDGNVTGFFSDGLPIAFFNNRPIGGAYPGAVAKKASQTAITKVQTSDRGSSSSIQLLDSEDQLWIGDRKNDDAATFSAFGYPGTVLTLSTVEAYRSIGGKPIALLDMSGHGGICYTDTKTGPSLGYGLWTATKADFDKNSSTYNANVYAGDLSDYSLGVAMANSSIDPKTGNPIVETHYIITANFPIKYNWQFMKGSYVTLSCCSGMSDAAQTFRNTLFNLGVSEITGWTLSVPGPNDFYNNSFSFDRMLGANIIAPVNPPRRPFGIGAVIAALARNNLQQVLGGRGPTKWESASSPYIGDNAEEEFDVLRPAIGPGDLIQTTLDTGNATLHFSGDFQLPGLATVSATLGGKPVTLSTSDRINYTAPVSPQASGDLVVTMTGPDGQTFTSNSRNISAWDGTLNSAVKQIGTAPGNGVAPITFIQPMHFRADLQSWYSAPDAAVPINVSPSKGPNGEVVYAILENQSDQCTVAASGQCVTNYYNAGNLYDVATRTLSGGGNVVASGSNGEYTNNLCIAPNQGLSSYLQVNISSQQDFIAETNQDNYTNGGPSKPVTTNGPAIFSTGIFGKDDYLPVQVDGNFNVSGVTEDTGVPNGNGYIVNEYTMSASFNCTSPPVSNTTR